MAHHDQRTAQRKPRASRTGFDASLILMTGFFAVLGGLALCFGPRISWKMTQIAEGLAYLGLFGGTFLMSGLVLVVLGTVRRGQQILQRDLWQSRSDDAHEAQLSDDVQAIGQIVEDIAAQVASMPPTVQASMEQGLGPVREGLARLAQMAQDTGSQRSDDAVFRMAASLDQLGARLEGQFQSRVTELENRIETLQAVHDASIAAIEKVGSSVESLREHASSAQRDVLARVGELRETVTARAAAAPRAAAEPAHEPASPPAPSAPMEPSPPVQGELSLEPQPEAEAPPAPPASIPVEGVSAALPTAHPDASPFDLASRAFSVEESHEAPGETSSALPASPSVEPAREDENGHQDALREALERMRDECEGG